MAKSVSAEQINRSANPDLPHAKAPASKPPLGPTNSDRTFAPHLGRSSDPTTAEPDERSGGIEKWIVIWGTVLGLCIVGTLIYFLFVRNRWEDNHRDQLVELHSSAKELVSQSKPKEAYAKYAEIVAILGDHTIHDIELKKEMADVRGEYIQVGDTVHQMNRAEAEARDAEIQARKRAEELSQLEQARAEDQRRREQARAEEQRRNVNAAARAKVIAAAQDAANLQPYLSAAKPLLDDLAASRNRLQAGDISLGSYRQLADGIADKYARLPGAPSDDQSQTLALLFDTDKKGSDAILDFWNTYAEYKARAEPEVWIEARRARDSTIQGHITSVNNTIDLYNKMVKQVDAALAAAQLPENDDPVQKGNVSPPDTTPPPATNPPNDGQKDHAVADATVPNLSQIVKQPFADVKVTAEWATLDPKSMVYSTEGNGWDVGEIPAELQGAEFTRFPMHHKVEEGKTAFTIEKPGAVLLGCTSNWGKGGGGGGGWKGECTSRDALEKRGWRAVATARNWIIFYRECKAGETFVIRTEKYNPPIIILVGSPQNTPASR